MGDTWYLHNLAHIVWTQCDFGMKCCRSDESNMSFLLISQSYVLMNESQSDLSDQTCHLKKVDTVLHLRRVTTISIVAKCLREVGFYKSLTFICWNLNTSLYFHGLSEIGYRRLDLFRSVYSYIPPCRVIRSPESCVESFDWQVLERKWLSQH